MNPSPSPPRTSRIGYGTAKQRGEHEQRRYGREERQKDQRVFGGETHGLGDSRSEVGSRGRIGGQVALGSPSMSRDPDENVVGGALLPVLDRADDRLLPRRVLRDGARGRRQPHRLLDRDRGVPRLQQAAGNDLSTPRPEWGFAGLQPGDRWCVCASRWLEAYNAGCAPVVLGATHVRALDVVPIEALTAHALEPELA